MSISEELQDINKTVEALEYSDEYSSYEDRYHNEEEEMSMYETEDFKFHAEEEEEEEEKEIPEVDIFADYALGFEAKRARELAIRAEAKKKQLRQLIGISKKKEDDEVSEETPVTPEEEVMLQEKSSESSTHPCLRDIDISDSQLKLFNLFTAYPVPDDPGLVPAFWTLFQRPPLYEENGIQKFNDLAAKARLRPIRSLKQMLVLDKINLRYYGIDSRIVKIICEAIEKNSSVETIDLKDNWLSVDACYHLNDLLSKNSTVTSLLLSGCKIGPHGAKRFEDGISSSRTLTKLDLDNCNLGSDGFSYIAAAVCNSQSLESLSLSSNRLDESCSQDLRDLLSRSDTLKYLNLSWNSLYTADVWKALTEGLLKSCSLSDLNLSWNALGRECASQLSNFLSKHSVLEKLNLSGNRFNETDATVIAKGLAKNAKLRELYLGNNPLTSNGALALISAVTPQKSPGSALRVLDLENVWSSKDAIPELEKIENEKPWLQVKLGGIFSNYKLVGPDSKKIFLKRANFEAMRPKKKRLRRNFGHFVLSLTDNPVSKGKFKELVKNFRLKLSETLIEELMNAFPGPRNTVDQGFLKSFYLKEYPDTTESLVKPQVKKKVKIQEGDKKEKSVKKEKKVKTGVGLPDKTIKVKRKPKAKKKVKEVKEPVEDIGEQYEAFEETELYQTTY